MANDSAINLNQRLTFGRELRQFFLWLTRPHPSITDIEQRRQSRLLAAVMISLTALIAVTFTYQLFQDLTGLDHDWYTVVACVIEVLCVIPIVYLNRSGRYKASARAFVMVAFML